MNEYLHSIVIRRKSQGCLTDNEKENKPREHYDLGQICSVLFSLAGMRVSGESGRIPVKKNLVKACFSVTVFPL